ncbi:MAG TPA: hypothetical protein VJB38_10355 [Bacteroidota bacterium]|nr:hypothetical protein [Bacteroidota bacterium]
MKDSHFRQLVGSKLTRVEFVHDYIQFAFGNIGLSALTRVTLSDKGTASSQGEPGFNKKLQSLVNDRVAQINFRPQEALIITFEERSTIEISLRPDHYTCPEGINLYLPDGTIVVE